MKEELQWEHGSDRARRTEAEIVMSVSPYWVPTGLGRAHQSGFLGWSQAPLELREAKNY